jgi:hypothetical protein
MARIVSAEKLTAVGFVAPVERYAEIRASLPELEKELASKWGVIRLDLRIRNPVYVPSQAEIHLVIESVKDIAAAVGLTIQVWKFLQRRFPWIRKPKGETKKRVKAHTSPRPKQRRRSVSG